MWAPNKGTGFWDSVINAFAGKIDLSGSDYRFWDKVDRKTKTKADQNIGYCLAHMLYQGDNVNEPYFRKEMRHYVEECYKPGGPEDPDVINDILLAKYQKE